MSKVKAFFDLYKKMLGLIPEAQRKKIPFMFFLYFLAGLVETLGISVILPFVYAIVDTEALMTNEYVSWMIPMFNIEDGRDFATVLGVIVIFAFFFKNVFIFWVRSLQQKFRAEVEQQVSLFIMGTLMKRPYQYFVLNNPATIGNIAINNAAVVSQYIDFYGTEFCEIITVILIGILIFMTDGTMAIGVLVISAVLTLVIVVGMKNIISRAGAENQESTIYRGKINAGIVGGIKEIYATQTREKFLEQFEEAGTWYRKTVVKYSIWRMLPERIVEIGFSAGIIGVLLLKMQTTDDMASFVPKLAIFALAAFRLLPSINKISGNLNNIVYNQARLETSYAAVEETKKYLKENQLEADKDDKELTFEDKIEVRDVIFSYERGKRDVLNGLSLEIKKGESVAFIGESGAGKTTLSDVILGLLKPKSGSVYVDGSDIYRSLRSWSKLVAYVPQAVFLLDDTIRANVAFGFKEGEVSDEEILNALDKAQLRDYVEALPRGLDTKMGDRGIRFSGGQRQRIAIARAMLRDPEILILDEATSALDNNTENAIMEAVDALKNEKTLIIVAHRLSTIKNCDTIYEIADGVATKKTHEEVFADE